MAAGNYNFTIEQGATLNFNVTWKDGDGNPVDLSGYQARMHLRPTIESETIYIALSSSLSDSCGTGLNLSGSTGDLPLSSGPIGVYISAHSSSLLDFSDAVYDLEMVDSNGCDVTRLLQGKVKLSKEVTR
jgi:hypothetical protein